MSAANVLSLEERWHATGLDYNCCTGRGHVVGHAVDKSNSVINYNSRQVMLAFDGQFEFSLDSKDILIITLVRM